MSVFSCLFLLLLLVLLRVAFEQCVDKSEQVVFVFGLGLKIAAAFGIGLLYSVYYSGGDTFNYLHDLKILGGDLSDDLLFADQPRAWFFVQMIYPFYILSFTDYWVLASVLSVLSFLATWLFYQELKRLVIKRWTIQFALFFIPSVVFWTSGLMKETVSFSVINLIFFVLLRVKRNTGFLGIHISAFLLLSILLFYLKYYLFAPLLLVSVLFFVHHFTRKDLSSTQLMLSLAGVLLVIPLVVSVLHPNMNFGFFLEALHNNYSRTLRYSSEEAVIPISYDGSLISFIKVIPIALCTGLFRPIFTEAWNSLSLLLAIENLILSSLFLWVMWDRLMKRKFNCSILVMLSVFFIVFLAVVLPIASPNYGSLVRYRTAYYPLFVLLVLQRIEWTKKGFVQSDNT